LRRTECGDKSIEPVLDQDAGVPVVAVDEHRHTLTGEHNVRASDQAAWILSESEPESMKRAAQAFLHTVLRCPDRRHVSADFVGSLGTI
jgi:hypothetical protein